MNINNCQKSNMSFILVIFILLVLIVQCFPSMDSLNSQNEGMSGIVDYQGFDIINNSSYELKWVSSVGTRRPFPTPTDILAARDGFQHFELPIVPNEVIQSTQSYYSPFFLTLAKFRLNCVSLSSRPLPSISNIILPLQLTYNLSTSRTQLIILDASR
ncbi:hypothetical protein M3223_06815 [Paenibacillus pasadenensis]|uniref:hypothetical protein n=1 Tax=Paenibacillus pasadenensis TaxID=217090 RepID=UPI00203D07A3|nr:hypothetical protein [Paenibacillus pasadenensis]MCM3747066.1 hypothetical protein [Paenibacillus pasadenensis]